MKCDVCIIRECPDERGWVNFYTGKCGGCDMGDMADWHLEQMDAQAWYCKDHNEWYVAKDGCRGCREEDEVLRDVRNLFGLIT